MRLMTIVLYGRSELVKCGMGRQMVNFAVTMRIPTPNCVSAMNYL